MVLPMSVVYSLQLSGCSLYLTERMCMRHGLQVIGDRYAAGAAKHSYDAHKTQAVS